MPLPAHTATTLLQEYVKTADPESGKRAVAALLQAHEFPIEVDAIREFVCEVSALMGFAALGDLPPEQVFKQEATKKILKTLHLFHATTIQRTVDMYDKSLADKSSRN